MNREVEERIVAMYFDNEDFEKNAKQTIDTLGQLKKGLDLKDSAKGFEVFDKIGKTLNFDKANHSLTRMKTTIGGIGDKFKKAFRIGQQPIKEAEGFLNHLRGYVSKYIGFDLAGKIVNSLESAIRQLTVQPVSAGWNQYQSKMDSVKTIMSSTGASISEVNQQLESMTEYANKTIYSLTDMTSNLGKFTNNGVELNRAVKAMEGIANATADAGQGAQQASMAMYNISQAIGVGKMTTIDWKSLENANIATVKLKNTFLEMAALQGRIKKQTEKDGSISYMLTHDEDGKQLKESIKLTAANFREYLSKGWLDKETMLRAFEVYSGTVTETTLEGWGIKDAATKKKFMEMGEAALESATQVRTFSKMMDALSESAQSGWAQSFELIFGNMEQGTTLWTELNNVLDEVLSKSAEARNSILKIWSGEDQNIDKENDQLKEKNEQLKNLKTYLNDLENGGNVGEAVGRQLSYITGQMRDNQQIIDNIKAKNKGKKMSAEDQREIERRNKKNTELLQKQKELEKKREQMEKQNKEKQKANTEIEGYQSQIDTFNKEIEELKKTRIKDSYNEVDPQKERERNNQIKIKQNKVNELQKKIDKLNARYGGTEAAKTKKEIEELEKEIKDLNTLIEDKTGHAKSEIVDEQGRTGREILIDAVLGTEDENGERVGGLINLFKDLGKAIKDAFGNVFGTLDAQGLFDFTQKIAKGIEAVVKWFGKAEDKTSRLSKLQKGLQGVLSVIKVIVKFVKMGADLVGRLLKPVVDWVVEAFGGFGEIFDGIGDLAPTEILAKLGDTMKKAWEKIKGWFTPKPLYDEQGNHTSTDIPIVTFLKKLWNKIKEIVHNWAEETGFGQLYDTVSGWWQAIKKGLSEGWQKVVEIWTQVKNWFISSGISQFFTDAWGWITSLFSTKVVHGYRNGRLESWYESPVISGFESVKTAVEKAWKELEEWEGWEKISKFASDTWGWILTTFGIKKTVKSGYRNGKLESWYEEAPVITWLQGIWKGIEDFWNNTILGTAKPIWDAVAKFGEDTWNWIVEQFSEGKDENGNPTEAPVVTWLSGIWKGIEDFWNNTILTTARPVWEAIASFAGDTWNWIVTQFTPGTNKNGEPTEAPVVTWLQGIWEGIEDFWNNTILTTARPVWEAIASFAGDTWNWILTTFGFKKEIQSGYRNGRLESWYAEAPIVTWLKDIWEGIKSIWDTISKWEGWKKVAEFAGNTWDWIQTTFGFKKNVVSGYRNGKLESWYGEAPVVTWLKDIWESIQSTWDSVIHWDGWEKIGEFFTNTWDFIMKLITGEGVEEEGSDKASIMYEGKQKAQSIGGMIQFVSDTTSGINKVNKEAGKMNPQKTENAMSILERILKAVGDFFVNVFEAIKGVVITPELERFFNSVGTFLEGVLTVLSKVFESFGKLMKGEALNDDETLTVVITAIGTIAAIVLTLLNNKFLSGTGTVTQSIGLQFLEIGAGLMLIASALSLLTGLDQKKLDKAVQVLGAFGILITVALGIMNGITGNLADKAANLNPTTPTERFFTNVINTLGKVGMLYIVIKSLPEIINAIKEAKKDGIENIGEQLLQICEGMAILVGGISLALSISQKLSGGAGISPMAAAKSALAVGAFMTVILAFVGIIEGIPEIVGAVEHGVENKEQGVKDLVTKIQYFGEIMTALGEALGSFFGAIAGKFMGTKDEKQQEAYMKGAKKSAEIAGTIDDEDLNKLVHVMSMMGALQDSLPSYNGILDKWINDGKLSSLGSQLPSLGEGLASFATHIRVLTDDDVTKIDSAVRLIVAFSSAMDLIDKALWDPSAHDFTMINWNKPNWNQAVMDQYLEAGQQLAAAIQKGFAQNNEGDPTEGFVPSSLNFNAKPIIDAIIEALKLGKTAIAKAVHDMVQGGLDQVNGKNPQEYNSDPLKVNQNVIDKYGEVAGVFKNSEGETVNVNDLLSDFLGDDTKWNQLLGQFDVKIEDIEGKIGSLGKSFDFTNWMKITDEETGEETDVLGFLTKQIDELGATVDQMEPLEVKITPVFDMSNLTPESLKEALAQHPVSIPISVNNGKWQISFEGLQSELRIAEIIEALNRINNQISEQGKYNVDSISALSTHMDGIADEVSRLQLVLDTGALVGGISAQMDEKLGQRRFVGSRTGVLAPEPT